MCEQLSSILTAISRFAAAFDPTVIAVDDAVRVVAGAAAIEASAAALKALAAARASDGGAYRGAGERSPADGLAAAIGVGPAAARELVATGRRLLDQPDLAAAAAAGRLSPEKVAVVANASAADPAAAQRLVELAGRATLASLRDACALVKATVGDAEERRRAIRSRRSLRAWTDVEGAWHLTATGNPEDGAQVMAALGPLTEARFRAARAAGEYESPAAYAFDALVELCRDSMAAAEGKCVDAASDRSTSAGSSAGVPGSGGSMPAGAGLSPSRGDALQDEAESDRADGRAARESAADRAGDERSPKRRTGRRRRGAPVKLLVRIDYDTWLRGVVREGETCELVGYGPVAVSAVRDLVDTGDPFVAAILTKGRELVGVAHLGRRPSAHQQSALEWLYPSCAVEDCSAQARLEADHRVDWARTHYTVLDLLDLLCHHHHALKTRENWALVAGSGKRAFVPPSDPRHPRHAGAAA